MSRGVAYRHEPINFGHGISEVVAREVVAATAQVHDAWAAGDPEVRLGLLAEVCAEDVAYANPLMSCRGVVAFAELISNLTSAYPGHRPVRTSGVDAHHDAVRYEWTLRDPGGRVVIGGIEIVRFAPDARLTSIVSFFGRPPRVRYTYRA